MGKYWNNIRLWKNKNKKKTKPKNNTNRKIYRANTKEKFAFTNIIDVDPFISKLICGKEDNRRANLRNSTDTPEIVNLRGVKNLNEDNININLRSGTNAARMVDFRDAKNLSEDSIRVNLGGGITIARIVNFRDVKNSYNTNIHRFSPKSIALNINLINVK